MIPNTSYIYFERYQPYYSPFVVSSKNLEKNPLNLDTIYIINIEINPNIKQVSIE